MRQSIKLNYSIWSHQTPFSLDTICIRHRPIGVSTARTIWRFPSPSWTPTFQNMISLSQGTHSSTNIIVIILGRKEGYYQFHPSPRSARIQYSGSIAADLWLSYVWYEVPIFNQKHEPVNALQCTFSIGCLSISICKLIISKTTSIYKVSWSMISTFTLLSSIWHRLTKAPWRSGFWSLTLAMHPIIYVHCDCAVAASYHVISRILPSTRDRRWLSPRPGKYYSWSELSEFATL